MDIPLNKNFIAFEGTECAGKTTAINRLAEYIEKKYNREVVVVKVPGQTSIGKVIRGLVVGEDASRMSETTNALLFAADYRHTLDTVVIPAIKRNAIVIADRYNLSMRVYQPCPEMDTLAKMNDKLLSPDLVFIMTVPYATFVERRDLRDMGDNNARDNVDEETYRKYLERYLTYAELHADKCTIVDCLTSPDIVAVDIINTFERKNRN